MLNVWSSSETMKPISVIFINKQLVQGPQRGRTAKR